MKLRSMHLWILSFVLVTLAAIYQRMTGPTYPMRANLEINGNTIRFSLPRSFSGNGDAEVRLAAPDPRLGGIIELRRFPSNDPLSRHDLVRQGDDLVARIPHQPPAGKVSYRIFLYGGTGSNWLTAAPVILRFKGDVPAYVMGPHILLMFIAMLFSMRAGFEALLKRPELFRLAFWTTATLAVGGLILGPIVQKFAFGAYWTGWPLGRDLTDNKTVVAFLLWALALWRLHRRPDAAKWAIAASLLLFSVYMIPHSLLGSEIDYTTAANQ